MTSQRLVEDFAHWLWHRDIVVPGLDVERNLFARVPDNYLNEAAVFLAGELGQRLQRGGRAHTAVTAKLASRSCDCTCDRCHELGCGEHPEPP